MKKKSLPPKAKKPKNLKSKKIAPASVQKAVVKLKKAKKSVVAKPKKKRVNFSWLSCAKAVRVKAYIAFLADTRKKSRAQAKSRKEFFNLSIYERVMKKHGTLYKHIKEFYAERGAELSPERYKLLLYCRFTNMYNKDGSPSTEHPTKCKSAELKASYTKYVKRYQKGR